MSAADAEGVVLAAPPFNSCFARLASHGNGSCFWYSIAACLNWRGYRTLAHAPSVRVGRELRARVVTRENWARYSAAVGLADFGAETELDSFEQAANPRRPSDNLTFALAAHALQLRIVVVVSPDELYDTAELLDDPRSAPVALIAWIDRVHFEPIVATRARETPACASAVARPLRALRRAGEEEEEVGEEEGPSVGLLHSADPVVAALFEGVRSGRGRISS